MKVGLEDSDLDKEVQQIDFFHIAEYFDSDEHFLYQFGLTPAQQADVKKQKDTQSAIMRILLYWTKCNPYTATFKSMVQILLELKEGDVAVAVCKYLKNKDNQNKSSIQQFTSAPTK